MQCHDTGIYDVPSQVVIFYFHDVSIFKSSILCVLCTNALQQSNSPDQTLPLVPQCKHCNIHRHGLRAIILCTDIQDLGLKILRGVDDVMIVSYFRGTSYLHLLCYKGPLR
mgnify:FL=1